MMITDAGKVILEGSIQIKGGGTPAQGKVLTATDDKGNAEWQTLSGGNGSNTGTSGTDGWIYVNSDEDSYDSISYAQASGGDTCGPRSVYNDYVFNGIKGGLGRYLCRPSDDKQCIDTSSGIIGPLLVTCHAVQVPAKLSNTSSNTKSFNPYLDFTDPITVYYPNGSVWKTLSLSNLPTGSHINNDQITFSKLCTMKGYSYYVSITLGGGEGITGTMIYWSGTRWQVWGFQDDDVQFLGNSITCGK